MLDYIKNLLPRLKKYSKDLDKVENFINREWVLIDDGGNNQTYEFMRDGRLVMTFISDNCTNQQTQIGRWDLLGSGRLLITRQQGALILNQGFLGDSLLILQESGTSNNPFCCYDPQKIRRFDINTYLDQILDIEQHRNSRTNTTAPQSENRLKLTFEGLPFTGYERNDENPDNCNVFVEGARVFSGFRSDFATDKGVITVIQKQQQNIIGDDFVFFRDVIAENGSYLISEHDERRADCKKIIVMSGRVVAVYSNFDINFPIIMLVIITILLLATVWL